MELKKLYVSPTGGSGVRVMNVHECPMKCKLYADGWRKRKTPHYFPFGSIIHKHAERPYSKRDKDGNKVPAEGDVDPALAVAEVRQMVETEATIDPATGEQEPVEVPEKEKDRLPRIAQAQMEVWQEKRYPSESVIECEFRLKADPQNPNPERLEISEQEIADLNFCMRGRMDLLVRAEDEHLCLRDIKTGKADANKAKMTMYNTQLSFYRYLWAALGGDDVNDIGCFQLPKLLTVKGVAKDAGEVRFRPIRFDYIFEIIVQAVRLFRSYEEAGEWPKNPTACQGMYNEPCPFEPICWPGQCEDAQKEVDETLVRRELVWE